MVNVFITKTCLKINGFSCVLYKSFCPSDLDALLAAPGLG